MNFQPPDNDDPRDDAERYEALLGKAVSYQHEAASIAAFSRSLMGEADSDSTTPTGRLSVYDRVIHLQERAAIKYADARFLLAVEEAFK